MFFLSNYFQLCNILEYLRYVLFENELSYAYITIPLLCSMCIQFLNVNNMYEDIYWTYLCTWLQMKAIMT